MRITKCANLSCCYTSYRRNAGRCSSSGCIVTDLRLVPWLRDIAARCQYINPVVRLFQVFEQHQAPYEIHLQGGSHGRMHAQNPHVAFKKHFTRCLGVKAGWAARRARIPPLLQRHGKSDKSHKVSMEDYSGLVLTTCSPSPGRDNVRPLSYESAMRD